jgi:glutaredoxin
LGLHGEGLRPGVEDRDRTAAVRATLTAMTRVVLYGRPDCHLCDEAREVLVAVGEPFEEVDIESDDELFKRLLERIPVVTIDGAEAFELFVDEEALRARLQ